MRTSVHLTFGGQCEAAFRFYERALAGRIVTMLAYRDSPMADQVPVEWRDKIVHASLSLNDTEMAGADVLPEQYQRPQGFYILLQMTDPQRAEHVFHALAEGGAVGMPLQKTFWSPAFGVLVDQFGIPWEISCEQGIALASK